MRRIKLVRHWPGGQCSARRVERQAERHCDLCCRRADRAGAEYLAGVERASQRGARLIFEATFPAPVPVEEGSLIHLLDRPGTIQYSSHKRNHITLMVCDA